MTKTLAQHKSVYLCFRPLLAVCKVYGSCAIQNSFSQNAQGLRYSYRNLWLLHCLVFHVGISFMMHSTLELRRQSTPVTCFYDLRKWCFLAALLSTDHERVDLLRGLERFDSKIDSLNKIKLLEYNPKMRGHFWHFVYHLVYTVGMNALSYTLFYPRDKTTLALFFDVLVKTFAAEMVFSYTIINIVFNNELRFRYKVITASWIYHMRTFQANPSASIRIQERLRLLHAELTGLAGQLGSCFGRFFVVNLFFVFLETMMYLYRTLLARTNVFSNVQSVLFLAVNVVSVPILASSAHQLTHSVSLTLHYT
ncbi:hypothetical protein J6590_085745 [Homalodisca vitripennis]|nr:hypothetical protein J6590_085745 [Homalodisca vitripennis]